MDGANLKRVLDRLGIRQADLARLVKVSPRTVSLWATGERQIPGPIAGYLRVLQTLTPKQLADELSNLEKKNEMLDEGFYRISYGGVHGLGCGCLIVKNGSITGADEGGGLYDGVYRFDKDENVNVMEMILSMDPNSDPVTGVLAGQQGARIMMRAEFEKPSPIANFSVDVAGKPVAAELRFVRSLPS